MPRNTTPNGASGSVSLPSIAKADSSITLTVGTAAAINDTSIVLASAPSVTPASGMAVSGAAFQSSTKVQSWTAGTNTLVVDKGLASALNANDTFTLVTSVAADGLMSGADKTRLLNINSAPVYKQSQAYKEGELAMVVGMQIKANADIPANTTFRWGTTGETWSPVLPSPMVWRGIYANNTDYAWFDVFVTSTGLFSPFYFVRVVFTSGTGGASEITSAAGANNFNVTPLLGGTATFHSGTFRGASATVAGRAGFTPVPSAGDNLKFIKGDGTWSYVQSLWNTATTPREILTATGSLTRVEGPTADKTSFRMDDANAVVYINNINYGGTDSGNKGWSWNTENNKSSMVLNEASNTIQFLVRAGSGASGKPPAGSNRIWCSDDQSSIEYNVSASSYTRFFCYPDAAVVNINGNEVARFKQYEVRFAGEVYPLSDGTKYLGYNGGRWKEIWCTQNSINTVSDQKYKTELQEIPDALLDGWGKFVKWGTYRWLDENLDQRLNVGLIAQDVIKAFEYAGLDYKDWQVIGGDVDSEYGLSALYGSLQIIENAYQRRRLDRLEAALGKMVD